MIKCLCRYDDTTRTEYAYTVPELIQKINKTGFLTLDSTGDYIAIPATFDIETSTYKDNYESLKQDRDVYKRFMYQWQMCIEGIVIFGRTWQEFQNLLRFLEKAYFLSSKRKLVIYVHNLSFEWQFLYSFLHVNKVFATDNHKVLKATVDDFFEFRCSYYLSNMSLAKFIENTPGAHYLKAAGDLDYRILRTPATQLSETENGYCYNDVRGLFERIMYKLKDDTLSTIPMTSTGYVRRDCRNAMRKNPKNYEQFIKCQLNIEQYKLLKSAFRGGNTASNRYCTNMIIDNVHSYDISSSYPFVMLAFKYPATPFKYCTIENIDELEYYNSKYCTVALYSFENIKIKKDIPIPYLPFSKCEKILNAKNYNGRILSADFAQIALTNIDYEIVKSQYDFVGLYVEQFYFAHADYLPAELREQILKYFTDKSTLKGVKGSEYEYTKSKNKLNSIFGMSVTDILHDEFVFNDGEYDIVEKTDIEKYYKSRNNFLSYQWGVFVTAYARRQLQIAIDNICYRGGAYDIIYCDTDSVKFAGDYDYVFDIINDNIRKYCKENNIIHSVRVNGKVYEMGVFDKEESYNQFITLGAKKYAYDINGKIGITVAGLNKKTGAEELTKKGGLQAFTIGEVFYNSGRTVAYYNVEPVHTITIDDCEIVTASNIAIVDTTYTLGITDTMLSILETLERSLC